MNGPGRARAQRQRRRAVDLEPGGRPLEPGRGRARLLSRPPAPPRPWHGPARREHRRHEPAGEPAPQTTAPRQRRQTARGTPDAGTTGGRGRHRGAARTELLRATPCADKLSGTGLPPPQLAGARSNRRAGSGNAASSAPASSGRTTASSTSAPPRKPVATTTGKNSGTLPDIHGEKLRPVHC